MSPTTYNVAAIILMSSALVALLLAGCFLVAAIIKWRGPSRNRHLTACGICIVSFPLFLGLQQILLWQVFLPSQGTEIKARLKERRDATSLVKVDDAAPSFKLVDTQGADFDLQAHRGQVVLVNFFATWCGPCLMELPHIQQLWDRHRGNDRFALVVLGREETNETVADFKEKHHFTFPMAADPDRAAFSLYAEQGIPRCYLIGPDGRIAYIVTGFDEDEFKKLESEMEAQLKKASSTPHTEAGANQAP